VTRVSSSPALEPAPIRVVVIDLEEELPDLTNDDRYDKAWVVGRRGGVPRGIVEVDLTHGGTAVAEQLQVMADLDRAATPSVDREVVDAELPKLTVVVPTILARRDEIDRCLHSLDLLDYPDFEVILVDNRRATPADDFLPDLLHGRDNFRVVTQRRPGISAARNAGAAAAAGDIVVFTDDDVQVDREWLRAIGRRFVINPSLRAVTGLILPSQLETAPQIWFEHYYGGFSGQRTFEPLTLATGHGPRQRVRVRVRDKNGVETRTFAIYGAGAYGAGANMAFRRSALEEIGGFDVALGTGTPARGGEDLAAIIDVLWAGGEVGYEPGAVVYHQHRRSYDELIHQLRGNGTGFTAMLSSLVRRDAWHIVGLLSQLPAAGQRMLVQSVSRIRGQRAGGGQDDAEGEAPGRAYPSHFVVQELQGMLRGPGAYLRSLRRCRTWPAEPAAVSGGAATRESVA
jgi:glycosyltransferase involved in cell wall biosynthesis